MLKQVNHQVAKLSLFDTYDRQGTMERKTRYEGQELLVAEYETDGGMKFYYWRRFRTLVFWWNKGTVRPENGIWMKRYNIYKVRTGEIFYVRSKGFLRVAFTEMQATELVTK